MMHKTILPMLISGIAICTGLVILVFNRQQKSVSGAPPYGEAQEEVPQIDAHDWLSNWNRPEGPATVALQAGHWKSEEVPQEMERLRNNTGSAGGGKWEWEVNLEIARLTAKILADKGVKTEILPTTIPPTYYADVFVAIHADGNPNRYVSGYKVSPPWRDFSGNSKKLAGAIDDNYGQTTGMNKDPNISTNMKGYYAFSWWKYEHALHPMTPGVIIETGFLTNSGDRKVIVSKPEKAAEGIAGGILDYLRGMQLI